MNASRYLLLSLSSAAVLLAGCASSVKLDQPAPIVDSSAAANSGNTGSSGSTSAVAPVVVGQGSGAADAASSVPRVVYFDFDSYVVKEEFRPVIEGNAKLLSAAPAKRIFVEGHTDERGGREYNLALGQKRAEAVAKSLTLVGVKAEQLEAVSFGKERPAVQGSNEEAWAKNRRVELKDR